MASFEHVLLGNEIVIEEEDSAATGVIILRLGDWRKSRDQCVSLEFCLNFIH